MNSFLTRCHGRKLSLAAAVCSGSLSWTISSTKSESPELINYPLSFNKNNVDYGTHELLLVVVRQIRQKAPTMEKLNNGDRLFLGELLPLLFRNSQFC